MTLPELERRGYDEKMSIGTLAGSGTLGLLIPPSIILIVYGVAAETSIARLFLAGLLPGLLLIVLFMFYVIITSLLNKNDSKVNDDQVWTGRDKLLAFRKLSPIAVLITSVLGSIYLGIATPTEAAAFGVFGSLFISALTGNFSQYRNLP